jgi:flagellar biosynthesis/type III secretory pathway M-ring protein FliF/YscJ
MAGNKGGKVRIISELFAPVPLIALAITIFVFALVWVLSRNVRMPPEFKLKEEFRDEVRFMLINEELSKIAAEKAEAERLEKEAAEKEREKRLAEKKAAREAAAEGGGKG